MAAWSGGIVSDCGREIESRQGISRVVGFFIKTKQISLHYVSKSLACSTQNIALQAKTFFLLQRFQVLQFRQFG
jgi:hypothetical protein